MAISGLPNFGLISRLRFPLFCAARKAAFIHAAAIETLDEAEAAVRDSLGHDSNVSPGRGHLECGDRKAMPNWKRLSSKSFGITNVMIRRPTKLVLNGLKSKGYEVYLVGGCVRDLILKRIPKDYDIITSAELHEVMRTFSHRHMTQIVGKRFPICHVHIDDVIVEVSSFSTHGEGYYRNAAGNLEACNDKNYIRWRNCLRRDFTINGLMFDPYEKVVYDYMGGIEDIKKAKMRTIIPATTSFQEDCARILRGIRIGSRLGFRFTRETAQAIKILASSVLRLDKWRLHMELNYLLAFGSAENSLRLMWKFGLLEILLPIQAAYFVSIGFKRRDKRSNFLLSLFATMDKLLAPDRPCHSSLWIGILAFQKAMSDQPRDPLVVATFCLAVYNGGHMSEAVKIARHISKPHLINFPELLEPWDLDDEALTNGVKALASSVNSVLSKMTDEHFVSQVMCKYPNAPYSGLVFIPLGLYLRVCKIFECATENRHQESAGGRGREIDYELLALGSLQEVRRVFARIVFDTVYPLET